MFKLDQHLWPALHRRLLLRAEFIGQAAREVGKTLGLTVGKTDRVKLSGPMPGVGGRPRVTPQPPPMPCIYWANKYF